MSKKNQSELLYIKIAVLEEKRKLELAALKEQYTSLTDSARPSNLLKQGLSEVYQNTTLNKKAILNTAISLIVGYFSKKIIVGKSKSAGKKLLSDLIQYAVPLVMNKFNNSAVEEERQD